MAGRKGRKLADARAVIIPNGCRSNDFWRPARRSREPLVGFTPAPALDEPRFRRSPCQLYGWAQERPKTSSKRVRCGRVSPADRPLPDCSRCAYNGFTAAAELVDGNSLALLAGRLHENFRDCGRLTGELQHGPLLNVQNNILVNPDYTRTIARIVSAVAPYPEARDAVIAALRDLDAASAAPPALSDRHGEGAVVDG